ncbi:MAG: ATP-dependent RecD-like DNA helicase [Pseudomonadota bacterium]
MEKLAGTIKRIIYRGDNGYTVLELEIKDRLIPVTVVGDLAVVQDGETLNVSGVWTTHPRFGKQFKANNWQVKGPESEQGLLRYLSSGAVKGIGPTLAAALVEYFGAEVFEVADKTPHRLTEVPGIGEKRAETLASSLAEQRAIREVMVALRGLDLGPGTAARIYRAWGNQAVVRLRQDPYQLVRDVDGIGFATADAIAGRLGVEKESTSRLVAGMLHLAWTAQDLGDTVHRREELLAHAAQFLETDETTLEPALDELIASGALCERVVSNDSGNSPVVGLSALIFAEEKIAAHLLRLTQLRPKPVSKKAVAKAETGSEELTEEQRRAVMLAASEPLTIITGGPGTGKTTILRTLVRLLEKGQSEEGILLCAPTGRAAKRMAEATGATASTVHRMLGFRGGHFEHHRENPLKASIVVVDEASMLDVLLTRRLLEAIPDGCRLVLVGDADQLPSVGPGNVLADIIASDIAPVVRLKIVFRQSENSQIVLNAHRICRGELPEPSPSGSSQGGEFHIVPVQDPQRAQELILEIVCSRIPKAYGLDPMRDIQVLSPMHRGPVGTVALNSVLQQRLNPNGKALKRGYDEIRVGDKVMQVRNDYDRDVFNGDLGWVKSIDDEQGGVEVQIDDMRVDYSDDQLRQLSLAYCVSVHKSQGSEYPAVVVPILTQHYILLQRNLLYTAVTRGKSLVVLVCSSDALSLAVRRLDQGRRSTLLRTEIGRRLG